MCDSQRLRPRHRPTDIWIASSDRCRLHAVIAKVYSQALLRRTVDAYLVLSIFKVAPSQRTFTPRVTLGSPLNQWRCASVSFGHGRTLDVLQESRADATKVSTPTFQMTSIWSCRSSLFMTETKNAESASKDTHQIPRSPSWIGRLAWVHQKSLM